MSNKTYPNYLKQDTFGLNAKIDFETADRNKIFREYFGSIQTVYNR